MNQGTSNNSGEQALQSVVQDTIHAHVQEIERLRTEVDAKDIMIRGTSSKRLLVNPYGWKLRSYKGNRVSLGKYGVDPTPNTITTALEDHGLPDPS